MAYMSTSVTITAKTALMNPGWAKCQKSSGTAGSATPETSANPAGLARRVRRTENTMYTAPSAHVKISSGAVSRLKHQETNNPDSAPNVRANKIAKPKYEPCSGAFP